MQDGIRPKEEGDCSEVLKMAKLVPIEHKVLKTLLERKRFMSTREISVRARISWHTASKYLKRFSNKGWLSRRTIGNRVFWKAKK